MRFTAAALLSVVLATALVVPACTRSDAPPARRAGPLKVLVLSDGGTENRVLEVLGSAGMVTTRGGPWWEDIGEDLHLYDVVLMLAGYQYEGIMAEATQVRLSQWVADGGALVATEWFNYYAHRNPILAGILPVRTSDRFGRGIETLRPVTGHGLAAGLPDSMTTGPDWSWVTLQPDTTASRNARVAVTGDRGGGAVVTGTYGNGRVVVWGMAGIDEGDDIWTPAAEALLARIARWAGRS